MKPPWRSTAEKCRRWPGAFGPAPADRSLQGAFSHPSRCARVQRHSRSRRNVCAFGTDRARFKHGSFPVRAGKTKGGQPKRVVTWRWGANVHRAFCRICRIRIETVTGPKPFTKERKKANSAKPFFEPWPSNGPAFFWMLDGESYDEQKYLQSLQRRGSPVWKRLQVKPMPCKQIMKKIVR